MKKCPYCAEEIQDQAIKCRHCLEFLDGSGRKHEERGNQMAGEVSLPWYFRKSFIILMFCSLPPLALPSVWCHPKMHVGWKFVITVAAFILCWGSVVAVQGLMKQLNEATEMLNSMGGM